MEIDASALRELHRIHRQLADLRDRLQRGPKQVQAAEANVQRLESELAEAKKAATQTRVAADDRQLQLKQREERIQDLNIKLNSCGSNREYQALKEQIAADEQANSVLSDEILEMLEKLDEHQTHTREVEENLRRSRDERDRTKARVDAQQQGLESELARVQDELQRAEQRMPADFKRDYERITRVRGEDALAQVEGESCGSCYTILSPQTMNELYLSRPVFCKSCGALLYMPEDRRP